MTIAVDPTQPVMFTPGEPGRPVLAWRSRAPSIEGIEEELARIWAQPNLHQDAIGTRSSTATSPLGRA